MSRFRAPGAQAGTVAVQRRSPIPALDLEAELEGALLDATNGDPPGPMLGRRLERVAREILLRRGLGSARVVVSSGPAGTEVQVLLPTGPATVRTLRVTVDPL